MSLESSNKSGLIKLCKEKEEELKEKTKALEDKNIEFLNYIKQKDEVLQRKDEVLQRKDEDLRKQQDALEDKDKIIGKKETSIDHYKEISSEREINHFLGIIHEYQQCGSNTLTRASNIIRDYETFFHYFFDIRLTGDFGTIFKGKILLWKLGDYGKSAEAPTITEFLCKLPLMYIGFRYKVSGSKSRTTIRYTRELSFEFKEMFCLDWMHKIIPKIKDITNQGPLLNCLLSIHSSRHNVIKECGNVCEAISTQIFFGTLFNELMHFLDVLNKDSKLKIYQERATDHGKPDGVLYDGGRACVIVEIKCMPLFKGNMSNDILRKTLEREILQLTNYMIDCECSRGLLTDSYKYILIEMDPSDEQYGTNQLTLKYKYVDAKSMQPSLLEVLLGFIQESIEDEESGIKVKELKNKYPTKEKRPTSSLESSPAKRHNKSTKDPNIFGKERGEGSSSQQEEDSGTRPTSAESNQDFHQNFSKSSPDTANTELTSVAEETVIKIQYETQDSLFDYIHASGFTRLFRTKAKYFQAILETNIDPEETIVAKVYMRIEDNGMEGDEAYRTERGCINRLLKDPEYNNIYLQHSEAFVIAEPKNRFDPMFSGNVVLSRYIRAKEWSMRPSFRSQLEKQLEVIHRNRIIHQDIKRRNILYEEEEEKLYIMDFSVSLLVKMSVHDMSSFDEDMKDDIEDLRNLDDDSDDDSHDDSHDDSD